MTKAFVSGFRFTLVSAVVLACFFALFARLFSLHIQKQPELALLVEDRRERFEVIEARRGTIVDARGAVLAGTRGWINLGVDPHAVRAGDMEKLLRLSRLINVPVAELEERFRSKWREDGEGGRRAVHWVKLAEGLGEAVYEEVMNLEIAGVYGNRRYMRTYPADTLAAHVLGYVNKAGEAVMGVERAMDFYLSGQDGWREGERDGRRRELVQFRSREIAPTPGLHVQLTLDSYVQHVIEREVRRLAAEYEPEGISIIVSEPVSGALLGLANWPAFDPNRFWDFPVETHRNRAVADVYEPGSVFKIVPAAAALSEGIVGRGDVFDCSVPVVEYRGRRIRLPRDAHAMGELTVDEIIVQSSNRGAARLGMLLGEERLHGYARAFGFGEETGYRPGGESAGILHEVSAWDGLTVSRLPMGHAVAATPLQVHYAMGAIANRGVLMQPQVAARAFDEDGNTAVVFKPKAKRRVVSTEAARTLADILSEVTSEAGTARRAGVDGFRVAGKTGTTKKLVDGRYSSSAHVASFSGFLPAEEPRLVITVVVDEPRLEGTGYGGVVAAPAFRNIAEDLVKYYGVQPERTRQFAAGEGWER